MKARKIDLSSYKTGKLLPDDSPQWMPMASNLVTLLFNPQLQLSGLDLLERKPLMDKLRAAVAHIPNDEPAPEGTFILLSEEEYKTLRSAVEQFKGYTVEFVELVRRVTEAEEVEVKEVEPVKP